MPIFRLIIAVALIWLAFRLYGRLRHKFSRPSSTSSAKPKTEDVVACATCGVHVPYAEAVEQEGRLYCCGAHANQKLH